jgi:hypothetical protein
MRNQALACSPRRFGARRRPEAADSNALVAMTAGPAPRGQDPGRDPAPLVDRFLKTYVTWREGCAEAHRAYVLWKGADRPDRGAAFLAYQGALDREESAARAHAAGIARLHAGLAATRDAALPPPTAARALPGRRTR